MIYKYSLSDLEVMAIEYANMVKTPPFTFLLYGDLGSGKTTFTQFFINRLLINKTDVVTSPTFNMVQIYETIKGGIWHADLYRVKNKTELEELGLIEAMHSNICIIEWPKIIEPYIKNCKNKIINF
ncbi:MAG: tRNA (adenosine(37)-N6)-threonylcarbamoyltransferase complex ATPase subunit type 1 TsaE [Holosporales bacterium]|jgi:tRNA threonylcarbamoyladenosine biosynthesis protein TsaE|nr:tRNA (adenosine(37)-N6)-threonylcarbamoyltransferase complex ATPase subunit type 1 TsaE [Holosporales bacterium]